MINQLLIPAMNNQQQAATVQLALEKLPGVRRVQTIPADRSVQVEHDPAQISLGDLLTALQRAGYSEVSVLA